MSVAIEGSVGSVAIGAASSTWDLTGMVVTAGNLLIAVVAYDAAARSGTSVTWDPTGANQGATKIATKTESPDFGTVELWGLKTPTAGTATVRVAVAGGATVGVLGAYSLTGVDTSIAFASYSQGTQNGIQPTDPAISGLTAAAGDLTLDGYVEGVATTETMTVGGSQTTGFNLNAALGTSSGGSSSKAAGTSMSWTANTLDSWAYLAVVIPGSVTGAASGIVLILKHV